MPLVQESNVIFLWTRKDCNYCCYLYLRFLSVASLATFARYRRLQAGKGVLWGTVIIVGGIYSTLFSFIQLSACILLGVQIRPKERAVRKLSSS